MDGLSMMSPESHHIQRHLKHSLTFSFFLPRTRRGCPGLKPFFISSSLTALLFVRPSSVSVEMIDQINGFLFFFPFTFRPVFSYVLPWCSGLFFLKVRDKNITFKHSWYWQQGGCINRLKNRAMFLASFKCHNHALILLHRHSRVFKGWGGQKDNHICNSAYRHFGCDGFSLLPWQRCHIPAGLGERSTRSRTFMCVFLFTLPQTGYFT